VVCLVFPRLSADRASRGDEALRREPLALALRERGTQRIAAVSALAARSGVRAGMTASEARAVEPALRVLLHRPDEDARALRALAAALGRLSPVVGLAGDDALALEAGGSEHLFATGLPAAADGALACIRPASPGSIAALAQRLARERGFEARVAQASTVVAARALARFAESAVAVAPGREADALAPLPPASLGISAEAAARLAALGVVTVEQLRRLPRSALPSRIGRDVLPQLDRALGLAADPIEPLRPRELPVERLELDARLVRPDALAFALKRLVDGLAAQLEGRRLGARVLLAIVERPDGPPERVAIELSEPRRSAALLLDLVRTRFERVDLGAGIAGLELRASAVEPLGLGEPALFGEAGSSIEDAVAGGAREGFRALLDRLAARCGAGAVGRVELREDHRPERAYALVRATGGRPGAPPPGASPMRPLRVFDPPPSVEVELDESGEPSQLRMPSDGPARRIVRAAGPERIETGWWDDAPASREYWIVEDERGSRWWLQRDLDAQRWSLAGAFA